MGTRVFKYMGSPVPLVLAENKKRGITYKLPTNLLEPKDLLKAKQKNKADAAKLAEEVRRSQAIEAERQRKERLESQERFAALLRSERERQTAQPVAEAKRGPGVRGTASRTIPSNLLRMMHGLPKALAPRKNNHPNVVRLLNGISANRTIRKANLLKAERAASKGPRGKFWKKEGTNNSNSD